MPFIDSAHERANCSGADGETRSLASCLWWGHRTPTRKLMAAATEVLARLGSPVGRVESGGTFEDGDVATELRQELPQLAAAFLRPRLEWYGCRGAFFHNDAHYAGVLFGVWSVSGPKRDLVFPRFGRRLPAHVGSIVVFDPFEPHAVLDATATSYRSEDYEAAAQNLFLGFEIELSAEVRAEFGIGPASANGLMLSSRIAINPETGAPVTSAV
jgi:hypothetical protein